MIALGEVARQEQTLIRASLLGARVGYHADARAFSDFLESLEAPARPATQPAIGPGNAARAVLASRRKR